MDDDVTDIEGGYKTISQNRQQHRYLIILKFIIKKDLVKILLQNNFVEFWYSTVDNLTILLVVNYGFLNIKDTFRVSLLRYSSFRSAKQLDRCDQWKIKHLKKCGEYVLFQ